MCFWLKGDTRPKLDGQIAHADRNPSNNASQNLVWLCVKHHAQYDRLSPQAKRITPTELCFYRDELVAYVKDPKMAAAWADTTPIARSRRSPHVASLEVYDRKVQVYREARKLILLACTDATVTLPELGKFNEATDEAVFLFNSEVERYLRELYTRASKLRLTQVKLDNESLLDRHLVAEENSEHLLWFLDQLGAARKVFAKQLWLG